MDLLEIAKDTLLLEAEALKNAAENIDKSFLDAVDLILATSGKLIIAGVGKSGLVGAKMAATFASTGTPSFFLHPTEALHGDLGMISSGDTLLAISYSGESEELTKILPHVQRLGIPMIAMTASSDSSLGRYATVTIPVPIDQIGSYAIIKLLKLIFFFSKELKICFFKTFKDDPLFFCDRFSPIQKIILSLFFKAILIFSLIVLKSSSINLFSE
jgi:D-arabinose 5-phosphate isomerase GutQ